MCLICRGSGGYWLGDDYSTLNNYIDYVDNLEEWKENG